jgi:hypothetical protein
VLTQVVPVGTQKEIHDPLRVAALSPRHLSKNSKFDGESCMLIHIDLVEVLVAKNGTGLRGGLFCAEVGDDQATIHIDWWETDEDGRDGLTYSSTCSHAVAKLSDLMPYIVGKVQRSDEGCWVDFQYYLTAEYGMFLLKQNETVPAGAELWQAPYRKDFIGDDVTEYYYSVS